MRIKKTVLPDGRVVSTADLRHPAHTPGELAMLSVLDPLLDSLSGRSHLGGLRYEVMLFNNDDECADLECERYGSEAEALSAHEAMVARHGGGLAQ